MSPRSELHAYVRIIAAARHHDLNFPRETVCLQSKRWLDAKYF